MTNTFLIRAAALLAALPSVALPPTPIARRANPIHYARYPHVANSGDITFTYMDDIWVAGPDGGSPRRLTNNLARDINPRFSPDGKSVAFSSNRMGNNDIYVVPAAGGEARQLTWHSGDDNVLYWTPDGQAVVFASNRSANPWGSPLYKVALDGTIPVPIGGDFARTGMLKQDMTMVAYNRGGPTYARKGYRGNAAASIAVLDLRTGEAKDITYPDIKKFRTQASDANPMWGADGKIYFTSERDGIFNVWRMNADGTVPQQVTKFTTGGITFPAMSADGRRMIFENDFDLWALELPNGTPKRLTISIEAEPKENLVEFLVADGRADGFHPSPTGDFVAVDVHGEIMIVPAEATVGEKMSVAQSPFRERGEQYSPDGRRIAYMSDESGDDEIWIFEVAGGTRRKLSTQASVKSSVIWSPNGNKLAWVSDNTIYEANLTTNQITALATNAEGGYRLAEYSGDGEWLVYDRSDADLDSEVYLYDIAGKQEYNVSQNPASDRSPALTADGSSVVFVSNRADGVSQLYVVSLNKVAADPNDPLVRARRGGAGATAGAAGRGAGRGSADSTAAPAAPPAGVRPVRPDLDHIGRRAVQLTRVAGEPNANGTLGGGITSFFLSRDGRTIYYPNTDATTPGLSAIGIDGRDGRVAAPGRFAGMTPTPDRRYVFYTQAPAAGATAASGSVGTSEVWRLTLANQKKDRVTFNFPIKVDVRGEWNQLFEESWRVMNYRFYDPKMHGRDWAAIKARYKPMLQHVASNEDVYALANEMIGELSASHTGVSGPSSVTAPRGYTTRFLGFELEPGPAGVYRVSHIYRDGPADKDWITLKVGDEVLNIDGHQIKNGDNYWKILSNTLNDYVTVTHKKPGASNDVIYTSRIASITSGTLNNLKYEEWVTTNREIVDRDTKGQIAYVHIKAMDAPSLARFRTEINQYWNKKGIIVDIRFNGGGNIDQELIDILERRPYEYWNGRNGSRAAGRRPREAIDGPKIMLTNHRSASDSEVTPMGFRQLGLGTIVGTPTSGQVIATGSYNLINGGTIRTPGSLVVTYDNTKPNNYGINLENYGVEPDVWARNTPMDEIKGFDRELKAAIDEALKRLKN